MRFAVLAFSLVFVATSWAAGPNGKPSQEGTIKGAFGITDAFFAPYAEAMRNRANDWLAKADAAKPPLVRRSVRPVRVVKISEDKSAFQHARVDTVGKYDSVLNRYSPYGTSFVLDFGEHLVGRLRLKFKLADPNRATDSPVRLYLYFAESAGEILKVGQPFDRRTLSRSWIQESDCTIDDVPSDNLLPRRYAFRYLLVESRTISPFAFDAIEAVAESSADESRVAAWKAPSEDASKLDAVARRTLRDCMQTMFEDGPKRDRRLWLGDLRLQALANYETFRQNDLVKRCLYILAGTANEWGAVSADAYDRPVLRRGSCHIADYTALFAAVVLEYLEATGDRATAEDLWPVCMKQMDFFLEPVGADGLFRDNGKWWLFIDHANLDRQAPEQGVMTYGLSKTLELARRLGREGEVAFIPEMVKKMKAAAMANLWDESRGVFVSGERKTISQMGQAWPVIAGIVSGENARRCLTYALNQKKGVDLPRTPYAHHYLVEALYLAGMRAEADRVIAAYWGGMLERGADTFWEGFVPNDDFANPYGNIQITSYCHAWSCAPAYFLRSGKYHALSGAGKAAAK